MSETNEQPDGSPSASPSCSPPTHYHIKLSAEQAATLAHACEVVARLGLGQFRDALECLPCNWWECDGWHDDMDAIGAILKEHMGVDGYRSSWGIHSEKVSESAKILFDLYQVLRQQLSWDRAIADGVVESHDSPRDWSQMMGVCYNTPMRTAAAPLASIAPVKTDDTSLGAEIPKANTPPPTPRPAHENN